MKLTRYFFVCGVLGAALLYAQNGESLFIANCSNCHGKDGAAKTAYAEKVKMADLRSPEVQKMSDADLFESIARGTHHKNYPHAYAMRGMKDAEVTSLVKFIRTLKK